ncbi:MAG: Calx-beta domain-containing protein [Parasphingorhabdus sp.]|uniref:Calx-beta domain-containing protein n=1 Tax=Parasphingorhabdus sp. TaxID=2709688 RepID=UPI00329A1AED
MEFAAFTDFHIDYLHNIEPRIGLSPPSKKLLSLPLAASLVLGFSPAIASETVIYTYDELGRLVRTSQTGSVNNGVVTDIDYDDAGNRTGYDVTGSNGSGTDGGVTGSPGSGGGETPPAFSIGDASAVEGGSLTFTISKSAATNQSYSVNWSTANGSALSGSDYTGNSGLLSFTGAQTSKTITIPTINNNIFEQQETFYVNLTAASGGATLSDSQGAGTISDDEVPNTPPVANPDSYGISCLAGTYPVTNNDTDADGDTISIVSVSGPLGAAISGGTSISVTGTTNPGTYTIYYTIQDTHGATASSNLTLTWASNPACGGGGGPFQ